MRIAAFMTKGMSECAEICEQTQNVANTHNNPQNIALDCARINYEDVDTVWMST